MMFRHLAALATVPTVFEIMFLKNKSHCLTFPCDDVRIDLSISLAFIDCLQKGGLADSFCVGTERANERVAPKINLSKAYLDFYLSINPQSGGVVTFL